MKIADYIADFVHRPNVGHVFTVSGAGDLHMLDALRRHPSLEYFCNHHEQACGMAAYSYACVTHNLGVALVTTGPGGTNAITGICSAWVDSVPVLVLSDQVKRNDMIRQTGVRQRGIQEINIVDIVRPFTKYAAVVMEPETIRFHLQKAVYLAKTGRPGPVWLDVPMDVQTAQVEHSSMPGFSPTDEVSFAERRELLPTQCQTITKWIQHAERPQPLFTVDGLDLVTITPTMLIIRNIVIKDKKIDTTALVKISTPGNVLGLQDDYIHSYPTDRLMT